MSTNEVPSIDLPGESLFNESSWQTELLNSHTSIKSLLNDGLITNEQATSLESIGSRFRVRIPRYYAALIDRNDPHCVIRKQAIPETSENDPILPEWAQIWSTRAYGRAVPWTNDPIGDLDLLAAPRLTHRYGNRALIHMSSLCALYCRFCFRKSHLNDSERLLYDGSLEPALEYLRTHTEVKELILTGGDPLSLPDVWLEKFFTKLESIAHLRTVRIHSRMAVTMPSRLTERLGELLGSSSLHIALVSHFNHPRELTAFARERLNLMRHHGVTLYNQNVLLRGVNDSVETLEALYQGLYEQGVTPFYLHHPDWTPGTFHFRHSIETGRELVRKLSGRLSGPAMPQYVLDIPGGLGKVPLLDENRIQLRENYSDGTIEGALYEVRPPHTLAEKTETPTYYAEFWNHA
jgi:lysine 2,3-aminomutase